MKLPNPHLTKSTHLYTDHHSNKYGIFVDENAAIIILIDLVFVLSFAGLLVVAAVRFW